MATADLTTATIGVITALPKEYAAVREVFGCKPEVSLPGRGAGRKYSIARLKTKTGADHVIAVALLNDMGNNPAAIRATLMKQHCPNVEHILMVGIAGAIPNPNKPGEHVRLGDLIISNRNGVVQYDFVMERPEETEHRHPPRPPGAALLDAVNSLRTEEALERYPWEKYIAKYAQKRSAWKRPMAKTDTLQDDVKPGDPTAHPNDPDRRRGKPRVFHGPIASANKLLKKPEVRDGLRDKFKVKAVEMEGSGIADASWNLELGYLVVRGACDYCNPIKGDDWQKYAALIAAAYARCVIEAMPWAAETHQIGNQSSGKKNKVLSTSEVKVRRARDLGLLKEVFEWLHEGILLQFFARIEMERITFSGLTSFEGFKIVVTRPGFKLYDVKLRNRIQSLYKTWVDCVLFVDMMDVSNNGRELFFRMPGDVFVSLDQERAVTKIRKASQPMRKALDDLYSYVHSNYMEIDISKTGKTALAAARA